MTPKAKKLNALAVKALAGKSITVDAISGDRAASTPMKVTR